MNARVTIPESDVLSLLARNAVRPFDRLPDDVALAVFSHMADRFSHSYGHDDLVAGIKRIAADLAVEMGYSDADTLLDSKGADVAAALMVRG